MLTALAIALALQDPPPGRDLYMKRCFWCHGETGRGDGPSAEGMFPRPRDFVRADYRIRSTPHGQLPTDEDLTRAIAKGLPGTPMPGWEKILTADEIRNLISYLKSLSPRFQSEKVEPIAVPSGPASAERGARIYREARCTLCHGDAGRGDGPIAATLNYEWGIPHAARDLTRGWTFKGGHGPRDIYLRITGGINGTPMGPYRDLLSDPERWDLAHYVASLDREPSAVPDDFVITARSVTGDLPATADAPAWERARAVTVPLAGQIVRDPPHRWWTPTAGSCVVRALHNGREIAFLVEWNDPTGDKGPYPDSATLQFPAAEESRPYFLGGDTDDPVRLWSWEADRPAWKEGRWRVIFRRALAGEPTFRPEGFVPILFMVRDGSNGERGQVCAISTWMYVTPESPAGPVPWLIGLAHVLGAILFELWLLRRLKS